MTEALRVPESVDTSRPSPARIYDSLLRGSHFSDADALAAQRILALVPEARDAAWAVRGFHQRAATWIAKQGIRQFLDIGSGLPTVGNTHDVVRKIQPDARVVYVDYDPMVKLNSTAIGESGGAVYVLRADLRQPDSILADPGLQAIVDPREPTGLLMNGVMLSFLPDASDPWTLVSRYVRAMRPGSYLSLSHQTDDAKPPAAVEGVRMIFENAAQHIYFRGKAEVARFFDGLELVPPFEGAPPELTYAGMWGAEAPELADSDGSRWLYSGVARIP
jgi:hypothetical protein